MRNLKDENVVKYGDVAVRVGRVSPVQWFFFIIFIEMFNGEQSSCNCKLSEVLSQRSCLVQNYAKIALSVSDL